MQLTELGMGKHHIGDFLPPEELERFLEKVQAIKEGRDPGLLQCTLLHAVDICGNALCVSVVFVFVFHRFF